MQEYRPADSRGHVRHGWLDSHHSFSFGSYHDPSRMGVSDLRVLNDDRVAPGGGFPPHGHRDMDILSYVVSGALRHQDSMGNTHVVRPGEIQLMHAGTGIQHSEMNASRSQPVHFLQIWIVPSRQGAAPRYAQEPLDPAALAAGFVEIAGPDHSVRIDQDARVLAAWPAAGAKHHAALDPARTHYLHVATGAVTANGQPMEAGDALVLGHEARLDMLATRDSQVLLFDLRSHTDA